MSRNYFDNLFGFITRECVNSECYDCPWETTYNALPCDCDCHAHTDYDNTMATFEPYYFGYGDLYLYAMSYHYAVTDAELSRIEDTVAMMKFVADEENDNA